MIDRPRLKYLLLLAADTIEAHRFPSVCDKEIYHAINNNLKEEESLFDVCHEMQDAIGYAIRYWLADAKFFKDSITKQSDCPNYREVCTGTGECVCEICACPRFRCPMKEPEIKNGK